MKRECFKHEKTRKKCFEGKFPGLNSFITQHQASEMQNNNFHVIILYIIFEPLKIQFSQGIIGADGRHYILDLFRTFPPDANFVGGK